MRKASIFLALVSLLIPACDLENGTTTTGQTPTTVAADASEYLSCNLPASETKYMSPNDEALDACANVYDAGSATSEEMGAIEELLTGFVFEGDDSLPEAHFCLALPDQVFVRKTPSFDPVNYGISPVVDGGLIDSEDPSTVQAGVDFFLSADSPAGLYSLDSPSGDPADVMVLIETLNGDGFLASPHYLLTVNPTWKYGPFNSPQPVPGDWEDLQQTGEALEGRRLVTIDTGTTADGSDIGVLQDAGEDDLSPTGAPRGHGTFAASIAIQFNPALQVRSYRASDSNGLLSEASVVAAIQRANPTADDVVNLSLGTYPCGLQYPAQGLLAEIAFRAGTEFVAASGNDSSATAPHPPMFPASAGFDAYTGALISEISRFVPSEDVAEIQAEMTDINARLTAVGALAMDGTPAEFSNAGEVYGPGENLVGWWNGGLAVWSGTSFAAPHFAACLATGVCRAP
jgi:hypothetical protein